MKKTALFVIFPLVVLLIPFMVQSDHISKNEILWDNWGVPHIYASSETELYYAFGWAQMHSHGDLIGSLYGQARGKAAQYWGEKYLETDKLIYTFGIPQMTFACLDQLTEKEMSLLNAFTDGMNDYVSSHPDLIDGSVQAVLPFKPSDVIAHAYRVFYLEFLIRSQLNQAQRWSPASNAWALRPSKSADKNAMLLAQPHLGWSDFWLFYEAHLNTNDFMLYGATLVGMPFLGIGFNEKMGWTHTVNTLDNVDLYELTVKDGRYLMDDIYHDFEEQTVLLTIRQDNGQFDLESFDIKKSAHGIIVNETNDKALALRFARMDDPPNILSQWYQMGQAHSLKTFREALQLMEMPLFNTLYADHKGNILKFFGGHIPKKPFGDWDTWSRPVSGDSSANIWTEYLDFEDLPLIVNPKSGWLQNTNDPPFTATIPPVLNPGDYPAYMAPNYMHFRAQQSARLLTEYDKFSFEQFVRSSQSSNMLLADRLLDELLSFRHLSGDSLTLAALDVLNQWDRTVEADSKEAVLFIYWIQQLAGHNMLTIFDTQWSFDEAETTPKGIRNPEAALEALHLAARRTLDAHGDLRIPYGEVYRMRVGAYDLPANGGSGNMGVFRTLIFRPGKDGKPSVVHGESFVAAIEFGKNTRAKVLLTYGNASQEGSPHHGDQLELFANKQMRDALLKRKEVKKNLSERHTF